jgi:hypothetical protein
MFNALGQIFTPAPPRQAEHADTRQDIRRHDPEFERRRKKHHETTVDETPEQGTIIAVDALLMFLSAFIKNNPPTGTLNSTQTQNAEPPPAASSAGRAASAYQNTASAGHKNQILLETTDTAAHGPEMALSSADIRIMLQLIEDLKFLKSAQIEHLQLERAATFLQSLVDAVQNAKSYL